MDLYLSGLFYSTKIVGSRLFSQGKAFAKTQRLFIVNQCEYTTESNTSIEIATVFVERQPH